MDRPDDARGAGGTTEPPTDRHEFDEERIEPGHPSAENVAFVLLGVLGALYVVAQLAGLV